MTTAFPEGGRYRRLSTELKRRFGRRVHKVTLRGGFGCPNRDGRKGIGGCLFCSEGALLPNSGPAFGPIPEQIEAGLAAVEQRHGPVLALAYFQDGTATAAPVEVQANLFLQALRHPRVAALAVGTRPDCIEEAALDLLANLAREKPVFLELGLQIANDAILRAMNRNHSVFEFEQAVERTHRHGLEVVVHLILDLPGTTEADRARTADLLNRLKVEGVKLHNLHILRDTPLEGRFREGQVNLSTLEEYAGMVASFLEMLDSAVVIHRLTGEGPRTLMLAPAWAINKSKALRAIDEALRKRGGWQGKSVLAVPDDH